MNKKLIKTIYFCSFLLSLPAGERGLKYIIQYAIIDQFMLLIGDVKSSNAPNYTLATSSRGAWIEIEKKYGT